MTQSWLAVWPCRLQSRCSFRYANLLREGAKEFRLDTKLCDWLDGMPTVSSEKKRGEEYWHDLDGKPMRMYPKIWKGSEPSG